MSLLLLYRPRYGPVQTDREYLTQGRRPTVRPTDDDDVLALFVAARTA